MSNTVYMFNNNDQIIPIVEDPFNEPIVEDSFSCYSAIVQPENKSKLNIVKFIYPKIDPEPNKIIDARTNKQMISILSNCSQF